ncbi:phage portal protein, partial [Escherichia coli]
LRTWLRDGEVFAQMVSGRINSLTPSAGVHFWLEALEPDFIPMTSDESNRLNQGVFVDDWGRPEKYLVYKSRPVSGRQMETKEVDAERMLHLKFVRRLHQMRGTSLLSGVLIRLSALKDYEDYELTAARIAAALGMYIRKGDGQSYEPDGNGSKDKERELTIQPGIIYDDLKSIRNMITPPRNSAPRVQDNEPAASRTPVQAAAPVVDENSIRAQVLAEQKARVNGI